MVSDCMQMHNLSLYKIFNQNYRGHVVDTFNFVLESIFDVFTRPSFPWHCASFSQGMQRSLFFNSISLIIQFHKIDFHKSIYIIQKKKRFLKRKIGFELNIIKLIYMQFMIKSTFDIWLSSATWKSSLI